jgi:hypothetical protein
MDGSRRAVEHAGFAWVPPHASMTDRIQPYADDVVLAAALFKPNASGRHELTSATGFGQRQLLKARGAYLAERVLIGVTALHVHASAVYFAGHALRELGCWARREVVVTPIAAAGDPAETPWPALRFTGDGGRDLAELQVVLHDDDSWDVLTQLLFSA